MKHKISIKWKIFVYLLGFTVILLVLLWFFQIVYLNKFYKGIKRNELHNAAEKLLDSINSDDLNSVVRDIAEEYDISINITDTTGKSIYSAQITSNSHIYFMNDQQFKDMYQKAVDAGGEITYDVDGKFRKMTPGDYSPDDSQRQSGGNNPVFNINSNEQATQDNRDNFPGRNEIMKNDLRSEDTLSVIYTKIITSTSGEDYVVFMSSLITPVEATIYTLRIQFTYITIIFIILATLIAFFMSKRVSKPIVKINNSAKRLGQGEYDIKFEGNGFREVAELSDTLNYAAKEIGRSEALQRELIANVSHDLRTPLTMISAYAEVMRDLPGENTPENVQVIIDETARLTGLVNDILDISKIQSGVVEPKMEEYDITESIHLVMKRFAKLTEQRGFTIKFEYRENVVVKADEFRINQVLYNLINNAINYIGDDKTVIVRQIVNGNIVRIEVEDHGKGIAQDELRNIWDRYYKVDKTHKRAVVGTGLGLSIVRGILMLHNAKYGVNSTEGRGSTFWFELKKIEL